MRKIEKSLKRIFLNLLSSFCRRKLEPNRIDPSRVRRILAVRQDERLGNLLMFTPFFRSLKSSFPKAEVWALISRRFSSILSGNPNIDRILTLNKKSFLYNPFTLITVLIRLMGKGFDLSFDCSHQDSISFNNGLFTLFSFAPYRLGFKRGKPNPFLNLEVLPPNGRVHQIEANLSLLGFLDKRTESDRRMEIFLAPQEERWAEETLRNLGIGPSSFLVGIHIGGRRDKRWDIGKFASLAQRIKQDYGFSTLIFWGPGEEDLLKANHRLLSQGGTLLPQMGLRGFAALLSCCRVFISGDCGPMHLASALGVPTLSVFLVENFYRYAPQGPHHRVVYRRGDLSVDDLLTDFDSLVEALRG